LADAQEKAIKYYSRIRREENDRIYSLYLDLVTRPGYTEEKAITQICDDFNRRPKSIRNLLARRMDISSLATRSVAESTLLTSIAKLAGDSTVACQNCMDDLDEIDGTDGDWVDVEQIATIGGRSDGEERTKRIAKHEARRRVEDRMLEIQRGFLDAVSKMTAKNVININMDDHSRRVSLPDLDAEIEELESKLHINKGGNEVD